MVLELEDEKSNGGEGYKAGNALRRIPVHNQLISLGFLDFWEWQKRQGQPRLFPAWTQHIQGRNTHAREVHYEADFFNLHRLKWNVPKSRQAKTTFHSFRGFFIQTCRDAKIAPYTILKFVGHDDETEAKTSEVHRNYMSCDLTPDEVIEIDRVKVPIGPILPFGKWLKRQWSPHGDGRCH